MATLIAIEADSGKVIYRQVLDFEPALYYDPKGGGAVASVTLAGKHLYVMDNRGTWISFKPGREYKQVARNKIDHWMRGGAREVTGVTPVLEGKRIYMRGREMLYCFEGQGD